MTDQLDRAVAREEELLDNSLSAGEISLQEYNQSLRELYRSAREESAEYERLGRFNDTYGRNEGW